MPGLGALQSLDRLFLGFASRRKGIRRPIDYTSALPDGPPETVSIYTAGLDLDR